MSDNGHPSCIGSTACSAPVFTVPFAGEPHASGPAMSALRIRATRVVQDYVIPDSPHVGWRQSSDVRKVLILEGAESLPPSSGPVLDPEVPNGPHIVRRKRGDAAGVGVHPLVVLLAPVRGRDSRLGPFAPGPVLDERSGCRVADDPEVGTRRAGDVLQARIPLRRSEGPADGRRPALAVPVLDPPQWSPSPTDEPAAQMSPAEKATSARSGA